MVNGASCLKRESGWPHQHENAQARVPQPAFPPARRRLLVCSASARWSKQRGLGKGGPVGPGTNGGSAAGAAGPEAVRGGAGGAGERALRVGWAEVPARRAADCPWGGRGFESLLAARSYHVDFTRTSAIYRRIIIALLLSADPMRTRQEQFR